MSQKVEIVIRFIYFYYFFILFFIFFGKKVVNIHLGLGDFVRIHRVDYLIVRHVCDKKKASKKLELMAKSKLSVTDVIHSLNKRDFTKCIFIMDNQRALLKASFVSLSVDAFMGEVSNLFVLFQRLFEILLT